MRFAGLVLTVALTAPPVGLLIAAQGQMAVRQPGQSADALARALQQRYEGVRDFSADFTQTYRGGTLRTQAREQGTVKVKKPGLMRWQYTKPERKEIVSDGRKLYMYYPTEKQVFVSDVPAENDASTGAMFLAGRGNVSRDFTAAHADTSITGTVALKLTPLRPQPEYEYLVVVLDPATLQIRALTTMDRLGGENTLTFNNLKENTGVSEKDFAFRVPRGVTVAANGTRS